MPATNAAMISMKLQEPACTNAYKAVATAKPVSGFFQRSESVRCTYPRQKISSAGPINTSIKAASNQGDSRTFC